MASGLMDQVAAGKAGLFATFGGQGYPYIAEAQELYAQDAAGAFMKPIVAALEAAAASDEVRVPSTLFLKPLASPFFHIGGMWAAQLGPAQLSDSTVCRRRRRPTRTRRASR